MATNAPARVSYSEFWIACASARSPVFCRSHVDRQPQPLALLGLGHRQLALLVAGAERVHDEARVAVRAAQVLVVLVLEPALPDPRALGDVLVLALLHLLRADLGDRAEQLGGELALGVLAQVAVGDHDALEVLRALAHEVELRERDVRADRDVRVRRVGDAADHALVDRLRADVDRLADAAVELGELRLVARDLGDRDLAGRGAELLQPRCARCSSALVDLRPSSRSWRDERVVLALVGEPLVLGRGERLAVVVGVLAHLLGQLSTARAGRPRPSSCARAVGVAVDDVAARRLDALGARCRSGSRRRGAVSPVSTCRYQSRKKTIPNSTKRDAAEHGDAPRQLGRDRTEAIFDAALRHAARRGSAGSGRPSCRPGAGGGAGRRAGTRPAGDAPARRRAARSRC